MTVQPNILAIKRQAGDQLGLSLRLNVPLRRRESPIQVRETLSAFRQH
jgi:hypothetical protein